MRNFIIALILLTGLQTFAAEYSVDDIQTFLTERMNSSEGLPENLEDLEAPGFYDLYKDFNGYNQDEVMPENLLHKTAGCSTVEVFVRLDTRPQRLSARCKGSSSWLMHKVKASGPRAGKYTPAGTHTVYSRMKMAYSGKYGNAEMPYAQFYRGCGAGRPYCYAIHGTKALSKLGGPASAGCIRISTANAKKLWSKTNGKKVVITVRK